MVDSLSRTSHFEQDRCDQISSHPKTLEQTNELSLLKLETLLPAGGPENPLSDKRTQQIQKIMSDEFLEEITAIIDAITTNGVDKTTYKQHMKTMKEAFAGGRGRQGRILVKKAGLGASVGVRKKTKDVFKKPTMTRPEQHTDEEPKDILGHEIEKAFRELPAVRAKIQEILSTKVADILGTTTPQTAQEPQRLLGPLAELCDELIATGFSPDKIWKQGESAKIFTDNLQQLGQEVNKKATRKPAYNSFVKLVTEKGIQRFLSHELVAQAGVDSRSPRTNTNKQDDGNTDGGTLPHSGFTPVNDQKNAKSEKLDAAPGVITVQAGAGGTSQGNTYPTAHEIVTNTPPPPVRKHSRREKKEQATTSINTVPSIRDNPQKNVTTTLDETTTVTTTYITSQEDGPDGRGAVVELSSEDAANKVFHMELDDKFAKNTYSFSKYPKKYLNFHGAAGSDRALVLTMINDKDNAFNIIILKNGAIIIAAHPQHGGLAACPEAMIQGDPLALEHSIPVEFSVEQLLGKVQGPDGKAYHETELPTKEQQEAFVRLQKYLEKVYGYTGLQPVSSAQVVTGSDGTFITPPTSDKDGLHTDTFSRRRNANGDLTPEGKRIAALRGRDPNLKQLSKPIDKHSQEELKTLDAALTKKLTALQDRRRAQLLPETTTHGVDYFTGIQKQVQKQITLLQQAEAKKLAAEKEAKFLDAKQRGDAAVNKQNRAEAETAYQEALALQPDDAYCTEQLATIAKEKAKTQRPATNPTPGGEVETPQADPVLANVDTALASLKSIEEIFGRIDENVNILTPWQIGGNDPSKDFITKVVTKIKSGTIRGSILIYLPLTTEPRTPVQHQEMQKFFDKGGVYEQLATYAKTKQYDVFFTDSSPDNGQQKMLKTDSKFAYDIHQGVKSDGTIKVGRLENTPDATIDNIVTTVKTLVK